MSLGDFIGKILSPKSPEYDTASAIARNVGKIVDPTSGKSDPAGPSAIPRPDEPKARGMAEVKAIGQGGPDDPPVIKKGPPADGTKIVK